MNLLFFGSLSDIFGENGAFYVILNGIFSGLTTISSFFTESLLGQIILCVSLVGVVWNLVTLVISRFKG